MVQGYAQKDSESPDGRYSLRTSVGCGSFRMSAGRTGVSSWPVADGTATGSVSGAIGTFFIRCDTDIRGASTKQRSSYCSKGLGLSGVTSAGGETGGSMLNISGLNRFYYIRNFTEPKRMRKIKKLCFTCNGGGHFEQLCLATKRIPKDKYNIYWVTDSAKHLMNKLSGERHYRFVNPTGSIPRLIINCVQTLWMLVKERPDVIISTGTGVSFLTMWFGKRFFGSKVIFVCSAANVTKPSRVPYMAYGLSDLFLVQWPEMKETFPNSTYIGVL